MVYTEIYGLPIKKIICSNGRLINSDLGVSSNRKY